MIDTWLSQIAEVIQNNFWLAPFLALLAGVLTSVTPCSLSSVPLVIGYVGGVGEKNTKRAFAYSVIFSAGTAVTFVTLGIICRQTDGNIFSSLVHDSRRPDGVDGTSNMGDF